MTIVAWSNKHGALRSGSVEEFEQRAAEGDAFEVARADTLAGLENAVARMFPDGLPRSLVCAVDCNEANRLGAELVRAGDTFHGKFCADPEPGQPAAPGDCWTPSRCKAAIVAVLRRFGNAENIDVEVRFHVHTWSAATYFYDVATGRRIHDVGHMLALLRSSPRQREPLPPSVWSILGR